MKRVKIKLSSITDGAVTKQIVSEGLLKHPVMVKRAKKSEKL
jgi:hypothetical protein